MNPIRLLIAAVAASLSSCAALGGGRSLSRGPDMPAAEGAVSFKKLEGAGTAVELRVKNLRDPEQLNPPGYAYVAWIQGPSEDPPKHLGSLNMDEDYNGELRALTAFSCAEVFVTAEATGDADHPTGRRLLWARCD